MRKSKYQTGGKKTLKYTKGYPRTGNTAPSYRLPRYEQAITRDSTNIANRGRFSEFLAMEDPLTGDPRTDASARLQINRENRSKLKKKTKKQKGGMYADNTVQAAGQGGAGTTASIVMQESNPELQEQRVKGLEAEQSRLQGVAESTSSEVEQIQNEGEAKAEFDANQAKATYGAQAESVAGTVKTAYDVADKAGAFKGFAAKRAARMAAKDAASVASTSGAAKDAATAVQSVRAAKAASKAGTFWRTKDATTGVIRGGFGPVVPGAFKAGATAGKMAGFGGAGISGAGSLANFATSGAGIGIIGSLAGAGITKLSDDKDPTKSNTGEYAGAILSNAGTGAGIGSMFGPVGTAVGGILGGYYGAGKQFFATRAAKKAKKKAEREFKQKQNKVITKANKNLMKSYGSQMSQVHAGNLAQKTYSGYDLGRNVVAQRGGYRTIPKYI